MGGTIGKMPSVAVRNGASIKLTEERGARACLTPWGERRHEDDGKSIGVEVLQE